MRIKSNANGTIGMQLTAIVNKTFPRACETGIARDLISIGNDPKSKGKAILFMYRKTTFRLTENLKVQERNFCNTYETTQNAIEVEAMILKTLTPRPVEAAKELALNEATEKTEQTANAELVTV